MIHPLLNVTNDMFDRDFIATAQLQTKSNFQRPAMVHLMVVIVALEK